MAGLIFPSTLLPQLHLYIALKQTKNGLCFLALKKLIAANFIDHL
jgi:hypothetical protein